MVGDRETGLVFNDAERAVEISDRIRTTGADVVGLTEVWDDELRQEIEGRLAGTYPFRAGSPSARGIREVIELVRHLWPRGSRVLTPYVEEIVDYFATSHYAVEGRWLQGALRCFFREDQVASLLERIFHRPHFWGAGLLLLSRHPFDSSDFLPHPARADLERLARKGVLRAVIRSSEGSATTVLLTHMQEGDSLAARAARREQIRHLKKLAGSSPPPVVIMGDFNVDAEPHDQRGNGSTLPASAEYLWMRRELGLRDAYREIHPDPAEKPGHTYDHDNPYAARLGVTSSSGKRRQRIDYVLHTPDLRASASRVLLDEFLHPSGDYYLSDHFPVLAELVA